MKKIFVSILGLMACLNTEMFCQSIANQKIVENGGMGPFKSIIKGEVTLPGHTIYRPEDLGSAIANGKLPVVLWGNGACANSSVGFQKFLTEIASHGYVIVAIGPFNTADDTLWNQITRESTTALQLIEGLEWITRQNDDKTSEYYQKIDPSKVAVMGQSCGGLQAMEVSSDPRIKTTVMLNSGVLSSPPPANMTTLKVNKESLSKLHAPVAYLIGDTSDIAYTNAMDDFSKIEKVPVYMANLDVGHGGTYSQPHGGSFAVVTLAWLNWQLKKGRDAYHYILGDNCGLCKNKDWRIEIKNF